jgi:hypothetical protein
MPTPADAISVDPADAIDGEFFDVDLIQDARLFVAGFNYAVFCFHLLLLFLCFPARSKLRLLLSSILQPQCQILEQRFTLYFRTSTDLFLYNGFGNCGDIGQPISCHRIIEESTLWRLSTSGNFPTSFLNTVCILCFRLDAAMKSEKILLKGFAMNTKNSHCSYCGSAFHSKAPWPRHCSRCGNSSYLNPIPVVVVLLPVDGGLVLIRRGIEPARGTLTLPGGYMDIGETWQEAGVRELKEETGIMVEPDDISLYDAMNGLDDTLVIFGLAKPQPLAAYRPFSSTETMEVLLIRKPLELGFPMHTRVVARYFNKVATMR